MIRNFLPWLPMAMLFAAPASSQRNDSRVEKIAVCDEFEGTDAGEKIAACIADLSSSGGIADARSFQGAHTITRNMFSGVMKPFTLLLCGASLHVTVTQTIAAANNQRIIGCSSGGAAGSNGVQTTLIWDGPKDGTVLLLDRIRDSEFSNFNIIPGASPIGIAIRVDHANAPSGGTLSTHNKFSHITIGAATTAVQIGNTSTANNDLHDFEDVELYGTGTYGYYINDAQSKSIRIVRGSISTKAYGIYVNHGSYVADGVNYSRNGVDNALGFTTDVILIYGCQSESANKFLDSPFGSMGTAWAVTLIGNRADTDNVGSDNLYLVHKTLGPVTLIGNDFAGGVYRPRVRINISTPNGAQFYSEGNVWPNGNVFSGSDSNTRWISINDSYIDEGNVALKMTNTINAPVSFAGTTSFTGALSGLISSGTYTPAIRNGMNVTASAAFPNQFFRVGNVVTVSGKVDITASAVKSAAITVSLPIPSTFTEDSQAAGSGSDSSSTPVRIRAAAPGTLVEMLVTAGAVGKHSYFYTYSYLVR